ncbi:MAG: vWA domain-containing protein [Polyangiaceae bacterium]
MFQRAPLLLSSWVLVAACSASGGDVSDGSGGTGGSAGSVVGGASGSSGSSAGGAAGSSGSAGSVSGSAGSSGSGNACLSNTFGATAQPANLVFQLDVSGSMNCAPQDAGCATADPNPGSRWEIFKSKLISALGTLPTGTGAALFHYPTGTGSFQGNPTGCVPQTPDVPLAPLSSNQSQISTKLSQIVPAGGTPTHDAVTAAINLLEQTTAPGNRFLVLATDGQATFCAGCDLFCSSDEQVADNEVLIQEVQAAAASGIRTFVLGAPGSEAYRNILSRMATAGGTAAAGCSDNGPVYCHSDMTTAPDFGSALSAALAAIGTEALSCTYDIPPQDGSFNPGLVNVQLDLNGNETTIPQDPSNQNGWNYSEDGKQIILHGTACDQAKAALGGSITILYGCPTEVIQ